MADRAAGPSNPTESHVDFASLPPSALDSYIAYYGLAKTYPPPPTKRSSSSADDHDDDVDAMNEDGNEDAVTNGSRRGSRTRNAVGGEDPQTTSSRLRPRSPSSSVAHLYAGAGGRRAGDEGIGDGINGSAAEQEEDPSPSHFFDVQEADEYLANVAGRHFAAQPQPKEGEVVVQFLYRCKASDKCLKVAS